MKEYNFLAFDIGATSGRAVLGTLKDAKFEMKEIHRFPNPMVELHGRFYWDIYHLYTSLIESLTIRTALPRTFSNGFPRKRSISGQVFK